MNSSNLDELIQKKMRSEGIAAPTIRAFLHAVHCVMGGDQGLMPESFITPAEQLTRLEDLSSRGDETLFNQLAVIKLNGGLGTGMGLDRAKSLLPVKGGDTFLDFIARQILALRRQRNSKQPAFYLMNSFSTRADTLEYLRKYPDLSDDGMLDFLQSKVPKIDATTFAPVSWPETPELEWCPPGHGDLYPSMLASGLVDRLLERGIKYLFVSNSDNLGATVDLGILNHFAETNVSFMMEVTERTAADRKGGHLARRKSDGRLVLRESAQCPKQDEAQFQDIARHRYFNTNNLWLRVDHLRAELERNGGLIPLPLIRNVKNVDPRKPDSPKVLQLESAMGAAIESFQRTSALVVPRTRFSPVKTTSDLLALRSDAYTVTADHRLVLAESRKGQPPSIELDSPYKMLPEFDEAFAEGVPSLIGCDALKVTGKLRFLPGIQCRGSVEFHNGSAEMRTVPARAYQNERVEF
ncbi:MAG: UTP--glucose-1-phosphate uridylyltransferase [Verrucomicrobia subdivision 3 bacterium]|nr:UTP--glucose-1-phosphate uridylyltransferase [Limisphaerales bacterium]